MVEQSGKIHRMTFDVVSSPAAVATEFEIFCEQHDRQWQAENKLGHFGDWPRAREFNRALVHTLGGQGGVRFYRILADDKVVSSQFSFVFGRTNYWRLPARIRDPQWERFSLGALGLVKMVDASIAGGLTSIEAGRGHYAYKLHHGGKEWPMRTVQVTRNGAAAATRIRLFKAAARLLHLAYYKVLFLRLAPRCRPLRRPLWPVWIRSSW